MKWSPLILGILLCGSYAVSMVELSSLQGLEKQRDLFLSHRQEVAPFPQNSMKARALTPTTIGQLDLVPCDSTVIGVDGYHCVNLTVPVDHGNQSGYHIQVSFFIKLAPNPPAAGRKAIILILGGPGTVIHHRIGSYHPILNRYDLVNDHDIIFMEQRCMGWSCGVGCVQSFVDSKLIPLNPDNREDFAIQMGHLKEDCDAEILNGQYQSYNGQCMVDGGDLTDPEQRFIVKDFCATRHAVKDLELLFSKGDYRRVVLYGPSYGGMFAQTYAGLFPNRIESLILDSTLDTSMSRLQTGREFMKGFFSNWNQVAGFCSNDPVCRNDLCDSLPRIRRLACLASKTLAVVEFMYAASQLFDPTNLNRMVVLPYITLDEQMNPEMGVTLETFNARLAESMNSFSLDPATRSSVARRVIAGLRGNLLPLTRGYLSEFGVLLHPVTKKVNLGLWVSNPTALDVCNIILGQDYIYKTVPGPTTPTQLTEQLINSFTDFELQFFTGLPLNTFGSSVTFSDLNSPVYSLAAQNASYMPSPGYHQYPIIVLYSTIDSQVPNTFGPIVYDKYRRTGPTRLIRGIDADHCLFDRGTTNTSGWYDPGEMCAEQALNRMISFGDYSKISQDCQFKYTFPAYLKLPPVSGLTSAAMVAKYTLLEVLSIPDYESGTHFASICDHGGLVMWGSEDPGITQFQLDSCSFFNGWAVSGVGQVIHQTPVQNREKGDVQMMLTVINASGQATPYTVVRDAASGLVTVYDANNRPIRVD